MENISLLRIELPTLLPIQLVEPSYESQYSTITEQYQRTKIIVIFKDKKIHCNIVVIFHLNPDMLITSIICSLIFTTINSKNKLLKPMSRLNTTIVFYQEYCLF
jgi:hypothetical protein